MERGKNRKKRRGGFSLAETLVAIVLLSIMSAMAVTGMSNALRQRSESIALADAQTVASIAAQVVSDQLRYGRIQPAAAGADTAVLSSGIYGYPICIKTHQGRLVSQRVDQSGAGVGDRFAMLGEDAYCGMRISKLAFDVEQNAGAIDKVKVTLEVAPQTAGAEKLWTLNFSVTPMDRRALVLE